jgi:hypothetical protein
VGEPLPASESQSLLWRAHITALCRQHQIDWRVDESTGDDGWSDIPERWIATGPLVSRKRYFTALHEVAHVVLDLPGSDAHQDGDIVFEHEARAWLWALAAGREPADDDVLDDVQAGLDDYAADYACREPSPALVELAALLEPRRPACLPRLSVQLEADVRGDEA